MDKEPQARDYYGMIPPPHDEGQPFGQGCYSGSASAFLWSRNNAGALTIKTQAVSFCGCNQESEWRAGSYRGAILLPEKSGYVCIAPLLSI